MSRNRDSVMEGIYAEHLSGTGVQKRNPANDRLALIERMHVRTLTEMCVNRFAWRGLPSTIDARYMELMLFRFGLAVFFKDQTNMYPENTYFALQGAGTGNINFHGNPVAFTVVGNLYKGPPVLQAKNCVPIWANYLRQPDIDIIYVYASRLADIDRTIEINAHNARKPKVMVVKESQRLSMTNLNRQIDEGQSVIEVNGEPGAFDPNMVQGFDLGVDPDTIEKMHILRTRIYGELMTLLGIDNANQDKKERLVSSEVDANNGQVSSMRQVNLNARRMAANLINDKYGLNVSVDYHVDEDRVESLIDGDVQRLNSKDM